LHSAWTEQRKLFLKLKLDDALAALPPVPAAVVYM
jgi:hypothetical protein